MLLLDITSDGPEPELDLVVVAFAAVLITSWACIKVIFRTSWLRAIKSWLPTLIADAAGVALLYLVIGPHVLAAYVLPNHGMAPTLLGPHQQGTCAHCGRTATVSYQPDLISRDIKRPGMCGSCQESGEITDPSPKVFVPDRFLVNRLQTPRRWDIVTFRSLESPSDRYVKRLVGLPGEELMIKDGAIWINGVRQEPPPDIARLSFSVEEDDLGSIERPARLAEDQYFVVGDFSSQSADSRLWGPLPGRNIEGVVSVIYWPPQRWRVIR